MMNSGLGMTYNITSMPTLLAIHREQGHFETKTTDANKLKDREWLKEWIREEARRGADGRAGTTTLGNVIFGGLFGWTR